MTLIVWPWKQGHVYPITLHSFMCSFFYVFIQLMLTELYYVLDIVPGPRQKKLESQLTEVNTVIHITTSDVISAINQNRSGSGHQEWWGKNALNKADRHKDKQSTFSSPSVPLNDPKSQMCIMNILCKHSVKTLQHAQILVSKHHPHLSPDRLLWNKIPWTGKLKQQTFLQL